MFKTPNKSAFTVLEALVAIVVLGLLAAMVLPQFGDSRSRAYVDGLKNDLRNYALEQELYDEANNSFASHPDSLKDFTLTSGNEVAYAEGSDNSWSLRLAHEKLDNEYCMSSVGDSSTVDRKIYCTNDTNLTVDASDTEPDAGDSVDFSAQETTTASFGLGAVNMLAAPMLVDGGATGSGLSAGEIRWSFGDGTTVEGSIDNYSSVSHSFSQAGKKFAVKVVRKNSSGELSVGGVLVKTQPNDAPTADFTVSPTEPAAGESATFDASSSSDPDGFVAMYDWDFGDGTTVDAGAETESHTFDASGTYNVELVVTDDGGMADTTTRSVTVTEPQGVWNDLSSSLIYAFDARHKMTVSNGEVVEWGSVHGGAPALKDAWGKPPTVAQSGAIRFNESDDRLYSGDSWYANNTTENTFYVLVAERTGPRNHNNFFLWTGRTGFKMWTSTDVTFAQWTGSSQETSSTIQWETGSPRLLIGGIDPSTNKVEGAIYNNTPNGTTAACCGSTTSNRLELNGRANYDLWQVFAFQGQPPNSDLDKIFNAAQSDFGAGSQ